MRTFAIGLAIGVLIAIPAGFAGGKLAQLTNPLRIDVDAAGHNITGIAELQADHVTAGTVDTATPTPPAPTPPQFTGKRVGWGAVDTSCVCTTTLKTLTVPPGSWFIWAPIRFRWGPGGRGPNIEWGVPEPTPDMFEISDQILLTKGAYGSADGVYDLGVFISTTVPVELPINVVTKEPDTGSVVDGDSLRIGFPAG